jgi:teichoic acid transport system permease protein
MAVRTHAVPVVDPDLRPLQASQIPANLQTRFPELRSLGAKVPLRQYMAQMWQHREFAATVPLSQLKASHQNTVLGRLWNLLNPLLLIAIYYLIFQVILGIESRRGVDDYLPFLTIGVIAYDFTRGSAHAGALSILKGRGLMETLYFPRVLLPFSAIIAKGVSHLYALAAMLVMLLIMGVRPSIGWLTLPGVFLIHAIMNLGLAFFVARFTFHFRDFERFLTYILRLLLYVSGVLIPINADIITEPWLLRLLQLNPVFVVLEMSREALLPTPIDPILWSYGAGSAVFLLATGFWYYRRCEHEYARV